MKVVNYFPLDKNTDLEANWYEVWIEEEDRVRVEYTKDISLPKSIEKTDWNVVFFDIETLSPPRPPPPEPKPGDAPVKKVKDIITPDEELFDTCEVKLICATDSEGTIVFLAKDLEYEEREGVEVVLCANPSKSFLNWITKVSRRRPTILSGYNIGCGFGDTRPGGMVGYDLPAVFRKAGRDAKKVRTTIFNYPGRGKASAVVAFEQILVIDLMHYTSVLRAQDGDFLSHMTIHGGLDGTAKYFKVGGKSDCSVKEINFGLRGTCREATGKVVDYCIQDVELCVRIFDKLGGLSFCEGFLSAQLPIPITLGGIQKKTVMGFRFLMATDERWRFSANLRARREPLEKTKFQGGDVYTKDGIWKMIANLDYASLYPSVAIEFNICHTTFVGFEEKDKDLVGADVHRVKIVDRTACFTKQFVGLVPAYMKMTLTNRARYKLLKKSHPDDKLIATTEQAWKTLGNGGFGACGASGPHGTFDFYTPVVSAAITAAGRMMLGSLKSCVVSLGFLCKYGDTDSQLVVSGPSGVVMKESEIVAHVNHTMVTKGYTNIKIAGELGDTPTNLLLTGKMKSYCVMKKGVLKTAGYKPSLYSKFYTEVFQKFIRTVLEDGVFLGRHLTEFKLSIAEQLRLDSEVQCAEGGVALERHKLYMIARKGKVLMYSRLTLDGWVRELLHQYLGYEVGETNYGRYYTSEMTDEEVTTQFLLPCSAFLRNLKSHEQEDCAELVMKDYVHKTLKYVFYNTNQIQIVPQKKEVVKYYAQLDELGFTKCVTIGLRCEKYDGKYLVGIDIDSDNEHRVDWWPDNTFGCKTRRGSHHFYWLDKPPKFKQVGDKNSVFGQVELKFGGATLNCAGWHKSMEWTYLPNGFEIMDISELRLKELLLCAKMETTLEGVRKLCGYTKSSPSTLLASNSLNPRSTLLRSLLDTTSSSSPEVRYTTSPGVRQREVTTRVEVTDKVESSEAKIEKRDRVTTAVSTESNLVTTSQPVTTSEVSPCYFVTTNQTTTQCKPDQEDQEVCHEVQYDWDNQDTESNQESTTDSVEQRLEVEFEPPSTTQHNYPAEVATALDSFQFGEREEEPEEGIVDDVFSTDYTVVEEVKAVLYKTCVSCWKDYSGYCVPVFLALQSMLNQEELDEVREYCKTLPNFLVVTNQRKLDGFNRSNTNRSRAKATLVKYKLFTPRMVVRYNDLTTAQARVFTKTEVKERICVEDFDVEESVIAIKAPYGHGKTKVVCEYVRELDLEKSVVIFITGRLTQIESIKGRLQGCDFNAVFQGSDIEPGKGIYLLQYESLYKCDDLLKKDTRRLYVIIDEAQSFISQVVTTPNKQHFAQNQSLAFSLINAAHKLIVMDGELTDMVVDFYAKEKPVKRYEYTWTQKKYEVWIVNGGKIRLKGEVTNKHRFADTEMLQLDLEIQRCLSLGQKIAICSDEKTMIEKYYLALSGQHRFLRIDSEHPLKPGTDYTQFDIIAWSPSIIHTVSIEVEGFSVTFGIFQHGYLEDSKMVNQMHRVRNVDRMVIFVRNLDNQSLNRLRVDTLRRRVAYNASLLTGFVPTAMKYYTTGNEAGDSAAILITSEAKGIRDIQLRTPRTFERFKSLMLATSSSVELVVLNKPTEMKWSWQLYPYPIKESVAAPALNDVTESFGASNGNLAVDRLVTRLETWLKIHTPWSLYTTPEIVMTERELNVQLILHFKGDFSFVRKSKMWYYEVSPEKVLFSKIVQAAIVHESAIPRSFAEPVIPTEVCAGRSTGEYHILAVGVRCPDPHLWRSERVKQHCAHRDELCYVRTFNHPCGVNEHLFGEPADVPEGEGWKRGYIRSVGCVHTGTTCWRRKRVDWTESLPVVSEVLPTPL